MTDPPVGYLPHTGQDQYPNRVPGEVRRMYKILPERVLAEG